MGKSDLTKVIFAMFNAICEIAIAIGGIKDIIRVTKKDIYGKKNVNIAGFDVTDFYL